MKENNLWSRRKFSKAALSLQVLISSGIITIPIGCVPTEEISEGGVFTSSLKKLLKLAMDEIIPGSEKMPAASDVGTMDYILQVLNGYLNLSEGFNRLLVTLEDLCRASTNDAFENLSNDSRISVLKQFEKREPDMFLVLQYFVYEGYYINEKVWKLIGYEPYPTLSAGPEMEPFDEAMLDRVKQMSPFYLNA